MPLMQCQCEYLSQNLWTELNEFNKFQLLLTGICSSPTDIYVTHAHSIEFKLVGIFLFESGSAITRTPPVLFETLQQKSARPIALDWAAFDRRLPY
jgi:hypothetical protein